MGGAGEQPDHKPL